jgi:ABC-type nitrate/sulfonate/bicarbonate transport system permease component
MLALGIGVGCLAGLFAALLRDKLDPTYTDADSFQQAFPGVPVLATIPLFQAGGEPASSQGRRA